MSGHGLPHDPDRAWQDLGIDIRGRTSGQVKTRCPSCGPTRRNQRDQSLSVNLDDGVFRCHDDGCNFQGRLAGQYAGRSVPAASTRTSKIPRAYARPTPMAVGLGPRARQFLCDRKIDPEIAIQQGVYSNEQDTVIAFPYQRDGEIVHIKYRSIIQKRFWSSKDTEAIVYNLDGCQGAMNVVIVEGELDALALMSVGIASVLSVPNGAFGPGQKSDGKLACLSSGQAILDAAQRVLIAVDADESGIALREELVRRIGPEKCSIVIWPTKAKDANETLMRFGHRAVQEAVEDATPVPSEATFVSAQTLESNGLGSNGPLFRTASEIAATMGDTVPWLVPGFVARGNLTDLVGKIKTAGKTTFAMTMIRAVLDGGTFLGQPCTPCPVVYQTEQSDGSLKEALRRAGLLDRHELYVMSWHHARSLAWPAAVAEATKYALEVGAGLLVVDTLGRWAGIVGDSENDAGAAMTAMEPLKLAASLHNLAVVTVRHGRKSGGEIGDDGRGSSAYGGEADIMLSLRRPEGNHAHRPNVRELQGIGRFDETPERVLIDLQGTTYELLGEETAIVHSEIRDAILSVLTTSEDNAMTLDDLAETVGGKRATVQRVLKELVERDGVETIGAGKRGDPKRYWRSRRISAQTSLLGRAEPQSMVVGCFRKVAEETIHDIWNDHPACWELTPYGLRPPA